MRRRENDIGWSLYMDLWQRQEAAQDREGKKKTVVDRRRWFRVY